MCHGTHKSENPKNVLQTHFPISFDWDTSIKTSTVLLKLINWDTLLLQIWNSPIQIKIAGMLEIKIAIYKDFPANYVYDIHAYISADSILFE